MKVEYNRAMLHVASLPERNVSSEFTCRILIDLNIIDFCCLILDMSKSPLHLPINVA